jgi:hypothetical protein
MATFFVGVVPTKCGKHTLSSIEKLSNPTKGRDHILNKTDDFEGISQT